MYTHIYIGSSTDWVIHHFGRISIARNVTFTLIGDKIEGTITDHVLSLCGVSYILIQTESNRNLVELSQFKSFLTVFSSPVTR